MDTFTATKGGVVGPYSDSVAIDAFGPVSISQSAIDAAGDIAGTISDETGTHTILKRGGSITVFDGAPGAQYTLPSGIDDAGDVIGDYTFNVNGLYFDHAFVYRDGTATTVGPSTWTTSYVSAISAAGTFAGSYSDAAGNHAFVDNAGLISSFNAPAGDFAPVVGAIDAQGDVAGYFEQSNYSDFQVYLDQNGKLSTVALPSDTEQVGITGVDAAGTVVGNYFINDGPEVPTYFIADPASPTDPGPKPIAVPAGGTVVDALGFDPQGDVVGTYYDPAKGGDRIFRTDPLGVSTPVDDPPGAKSTDLTGIGPDGTLFGSYQDATGSHLFTDRAGVVTTVPTVTNSKDPYITGEDTAGDVVGEYTKIYPNAVDPTFLYQNGMSAPLTLPGKPLGVSLFAIDGTGDIVGTTQDADGIHMFVDEGGTVTTQDAAPGAYSTTPVFVDDAGDIIGHDTDSNGFEHLFVDKNGTFTTVNIPAPAGLFAAAPMIETADANGDFAGEVQFVAQGETPEASLFADVDGTVTAFTIPTSVGYFPLLVGMDPQGDIGIAASGPSNGQVVSSLRMVDGSFQPIVVPGSVADSTDLQRIDRAGNYIGTYQAPSAQGGAPVSMGFVRLARSGAYVTVAPPAGVTGSSPSAVDAAGDVFGAVTDPDYTNGIFEQKAGVAQGTVVNLGSGTGREFLVGVDAAGDIAANAYSTQAYQGGPTQAYLVIGGQVTQVEGSPSATSTAINSIDAAGDIIGIYTDATGEHDFASFASSPPRISNTHASGTTGEAPVPPFAGVTVQDLRYGASDTLTIALSGGGGTLADGSGFAGPSTLRQTGSGTYALTGTAPSITAEFDALSFTPSAGAPGTPNPTRFTLTDASSVGGSATETVTDAATVVTDTAAGATSTGTGGAGTGGGTGTGGTVGTGTGGAGTGMGSTGTGSAGGTGTGTGTGGAGTGGTVGTGTGTGTGTGGTAPAPVTSDTASLDGTVSYRHGTFTLTGHASSPAGGGSVTISAMVDCTRKLLGTAPVNADGTFALQDAAGDQQFFFVATLTDAAGAQATSADPGFNLTGGLGPSAGAGRQESFDATGQVSTTLFRPNGLRSIGIEAVGQTVDLQPYDVVSDRHWGDTTFVYAPGSGRGAVDTIHGFRLGGPDHDTIQLPSADFRDFADVLRDTGDVGGSAFITDPKTGDAIRLAGVTTAELKQHPKDVTFHA